MKRPTLGAWTAQSLTATALAFMLACGATMPPNELVEARAAYHRAEAGPAGKVAPAQVHVAKKALDDAEKAFDDQGDQPEVRDKAYVALRKAQTAEARAGASVAEQQKTQAQKEIGQSTQSELQSTRKALEDTRNKLQLEQQQRVEAERRSKEALEQLAKLAAIKEEARGTVITINGNVLFPSNQSVLLPGAISALDNVVTTLKAAPDRDVLVEGHTDSQGARAYNMELALKRAESVRQHFISRGIQPERVKATGIGPDRPIADNKTPEGRAQNRRVEIIVSPPERK
jgi:outer membrane protein OmpA-like peptidoglycan-associated protein